MSAALLHSLWTIVAMAAFAGIVIWAWSRRARKGFDEAARLPLDDDLEPAVPERENDDA
jgi:cytochrome c oxidase cbb3-type subunit 4